MYRLVNPIQSRLIRWGGIARAGRASSTTLNRVTDEAETSSVAPDHDCLRVPVWGIADDPGSALAMDRSADELVYQPGEVGGLRCAPGVGRSGMQMSPFLPIAVVAAEDQNFPHHLGFDIESIRSALEEDRPRQRGASTISQQVVEESVSLAEAQAGSAKGSRPTSPSLSRCCGPSDAFWRSISTSPNSVPVSLVPKQQPDGSLDRPAKEVTARQAAILAAVLPNPKHLSAAKPTRYVEERVAWILRQMKQLGGPAYLEAI